MPPNPVLPNQQAHTQVLRKVVGYKLCSSEVQSNVLFRPALLKYAEQQSFVCMSFFFFYFFMSFNPLSRFYVTLKFQFLTSHTQRKCDLICVHACLCVWNTVPFRYVHSTSWPVSPLIQVLTGLQLKPTTKEMKILKALTTRSKSSLFQITDTSFCL